jgi:2,3,4,5-tetrahydropyridine-2-carboxylate N-succinyltransferase
MNPSQVFEILSDLDIGRRRVASPQASGWTVDTEAKEAILAYFKLMKVRPIFSGELEFLDKIPLKKWSPELGVRVVPPAVARFGSFIEAGAILMPSYVNIGAYVGAGTMVDTWATVGSCAQIGKNVHLSGGVGIGGVLEPVQASPVIIEDDAFIGSRCIVVEGVHIKAGAVLGAGVTLTSSTKIIDVTGASEKILHGVIPENSVVIPGNYQKEFPAGRYGVSCALIIGKRKESTDKKTSLNQTLREFNVSV